MNYGANKTFFEVSSMYNPQKYKSIKMLIKGIFPYLAKKKSHQTQILISTRFYSKN